MSKGELMSAAGSKAARSKSGSGLPHSRAFGYRGYATKLFPGPIV
jgi:hypothetical protein